MRVGWDGPDRLDAKAEALGRWPAMSHLPAMAEWERLRRLREAGREPPADQRRSIR